MPAQTQQPPPQAAPETTPFSSQRCVFYPVLRDANPLESKREKDVLSLATTRTESGAWVGGGFTRFGDAAFFYLPAGAVVARPSSLRTKPPPFLHSRPLHCWARWVEGLRDAFCVFAGFGVGFREAGMRADAAMRARDGTRFVCPFPCPFPVRCFDECPCGAGGGALLVRIQIGLIVSRDTFGVRRGVSPCGKIGARIDCSVKNLIAVASPRPQTLVTITGKRKRRSADSVEDRPARKLSVLHPLPPPSSSLYSTASLRGADKVHSGGDVTAVCWNPSGTRLLSVDTSGAVVVWAPHKHCLDEWDPVIAGSVGSPVVAVEWFKENRRYRLAPDTRPRASSNPAVADVEVVDLTDGSPPPTDVNGLEITPRVSFRRGAFEGLLPLAGPAFVVLTDDAKLHVFHLDPATNSWNDFSTALPGFDALSEASPFGSSTDRIVLADVIPIAVNTVRVVAHCPAIMVDSVAVIDAVVRCAESAIDCKELPPVPLSSDEATSAQPPTHLRFASPTQLLIVLPTSPNPPTLTTATLTTPASWTLTSTALTSASASHATALQVNRADGIALVACADGTVRACKVGADTDTGFGLACFPGGGVAWTVMPGDPIDGLALSPNAVEVFVWRDPVGVGRGGVVERCLCAAEVGVGSLSPEALESLVNNFANRLTLSLLHNVDYADLVGLLRELHVRLDLKDLPERVLAQVHRRYDRALKPNAPHTAATFPLPLEGSSLAIEGRLFGLQMAVFQSLATRRIQHRNTYITLQLYVVLTTCLSGFKNPRFARDRLFAATSGEIAAITVDDFRKDLIPHVAFQVIWALEIVAHLMRQVSLCFNLKRKPEEVDVVVVDDGAAASPPWPPPPPTPLALFSHPATHRALQATLYLSTLLMSRLKRDLSRLSAPTLADADSLRTPLTNLVTALTRTHLNLDHTKEIIAAFRPTVPPKDAIASTLAAPFPAPETLAAVRAAFDARHGDLFLDRTAASAVDFVWVGVDPVVGGAPLERFDVVGKMG
ncbi:hypothetical protein BDK51DRAFT_46407, partial [Blyttiomyces helicus]